MIRIVDYLFGNYKWYRKLRSGEWVYLRMGYGDAARISHWFKRPLPKGWEGQFIEMSTEYYGKAMEF